MSGGLVVAIATLIIGAPPTYWAMFRSIRKDREAAAEALQDRLDEAEQKGREQAEKDQELSEIKQRLRRLGGDEQ